MQERKRGEETNVPAGRGRKAGRILLTQTGELGESEEKNTFSSHESAVGREKIRDGAFFIA